MKVMILAAGRGQRMRELTENCPKPLLRVGDKPLIVRLLEQLRAAGLTDLVVNHAWQGQQLVDALGDGCNWGVRIQWSPESTALETAGGIANALPLLGEQPFAVVNGDILTYYPFAGLPALGDTLVARGLQAGCVLVPNPPHHPDGDFVIDGDGLLRQGPSSHPGVPDTMTFAGIGIYIPTVFDAIQPGQAAPLGPVLRELADRGKVAAWSHAGIWSDIGTPERLNDAARLLTLLDATKRA